MTKILVTGSECSGKSTLVKGLASHFRAPIISEFSRVYLSLVGGRYTEKDLLAMASAQQSMSEALSGLMPPLQIHDTSWLVFNIWSRIRYGHIAPELLAGLNQMNFDLVLLCEPTPQYKEDSLREHPLSRWSLYYLYHREIIDRGYSFQIIKGGPSKRLAQGIEAIQCLA